MFKELTAIGQIHFLGDKLVNSASKPGTEATGRRERAMGALMSSSLASCCSSRGN